MVSIDELKMILDMPKAENHIHIEGSILPDTAVRLAARNGVRLPFQTAAEFGEYARNSVVDLNSFMACDRLINSVCLHAEDYEEVIVDLACTAHKQNIIYQEYHLDYPLNGERGIPLEVVMEGYRRGKERALSEYGVDIVYIAGIDRTLSPEKCATFIAAMKDYLDIVRGIGMDCEEIGHPCAEHIQSYRLAAEMGLFLTAHAGEDAGVPDGEMEIWRALKELGVQRIDHGCQAIKDPALMDYLAENKILLTECPSGNVLGGNAKSLATHPMVTYYKMGIPVSINSDDPPYCGELAWEYVRCLDAMDISAEDLIQIARNAFVYSICGQKYLPVFDGWAEKWRMRK